MRVIDWVVPVLLLVAGASAQVLPPAEISDPEMRELQQKYLGELKRITLAVAQHDFPYHFYYSRKLDLTESEQHRSDQRSVQFDRYHDQTVLKITGNYFASYSTELMKPEERARQTYEDVMLPLLEASVPLFATSSVPEAFAFEISHHVRKKVLGVSSEGIENVVLILPKASALRMMTAPSGAMKQAAAAEGQAFLNAAPVEMWPGLHALAPVATLAKAPAPTVARAAVAREVSVPERDSSPEALKNIQTFYQASLDRMVQELNSQAHFVNYAPPAFMQFHKGIYLQLSLATELPEAAAGSQYKVAALAFDLHIAHLIRPTLEYLKDERGDFDGIDFSTSARLGPANGSGSSPTAVEFIFPLKMLALYKQFDCTGQQLIDSGFVLINGERVSLDLQIAESGAR